MSLLFKMQWHFQKLQVILQWTLSMGQTQHLIYLIFISLPNLTAPKHYPSPSLNSQLAIEMGLRGGPCCSHLTWSTESSKEGSQPLICAVTTQVYHLPSADSGTNFQFSVGWLLCYFVLFWFSCIMHCWFSEMGRWEASGRNNKINIACNSRSAPKTLQNNCGATCILHPCSLHIWHDDTFILLVGITTWVSKKRKSEIPNLSCNLLLVSPDEGCTPWKCEPISRPFIWWVSLCHRDGVLLQRKPRGFAAKHKHKAGLDVQIISSDGLN